MPIVEVSDRVTTTSGTTYSGTIYASNIFGMSYFQLLPNGDKIHSSSSLYTNRAPISLFDGITSNWNNAWHGLSGDTTMYALYEFVNSQAKSVSIMNFGQIPDTSGHYAGVINIYYWNGSSYEEVTYTSGHEFVSTTPGQVITVSFDRVKSLHFKIQVNRHITNTTPYVGLSLWTLKNDPNGPATPNPIVLDKAIDTNGDLVDLYTVNTGYLYVWAKTLGSSDFAGGRSAIQGVGTTTVPAFDRSVYTTANDALTQTLITTAIFDRDTPANMYPGQATRGTLGMVTLSNGDKFYGPTIWSPGDETGHVGTFINNNGTNTLPATQTGRFRPSKTYGGSTTIISGLNIHGGWEFYYEPANECEVNSCTLNVLPTGNLYVYKIGTIEGTTFTSVRNTSVTLPYSIASTDYSINGMFISFDSVLVGPGKPLKIELIQNNDEAYITEVQLDYVANAAKNVLYVPPPIFSKLWRFKMKSYLYRPSLADNYTSFYPNDDATYGIVSGFFNKDGQDIFKPTVSDPAHHELNSTNGMANIEVNAYGYFGNNSEFNPFTTFSNNMNNGPLSLSSGGTVSSHRLSNPTGYDASSGVYGYVNEYILMTFKDGIDGSQFTKITQNFNRTRSEYALEYYENYDGTYDEANWKTYATLQVPNAETTPYPIWASWDNITQGSTIIAKTDKNP
jgi:hypothetical protein